MTLEKAMKMATQSGVNCLKLHTTFVKIVNRNFFDFKDRPITLTEEEKQSSDWQVWLPQQGKFKNEQ